MQLSHVTWKGPAPDDGDILSKLPADLNELLKQINGFIQFHGGLHVRGASLSPGWHSLREAWLGPQAFHRLYAKVRQSDVPFAEDFLGNQFLLRNGKVVLLEGETGEIEPLKLTMKEFFASVARDPVEALELDILMEFQEEGGELRPGELLAVIPPLCSNEASDGYSTSAVPAAERYTFLAELAEFLKELPKGSSFSFAPED